MEWGSRQMEVQRFDLFIFSFWVAADKNPANISLK